MKNEMNGFSKIDRWDYKAWWKLNKVALDIIPVILGIRYCKTVKVGRIYHIIAQEFM